MFTKLDRHTVGLDTSMSCSGIKRYTTVACFRFWDRMVKSSGVISGPQIRFIAFGKVLREFHLNRNLTYIWGQTSSLLCHTPENRTLGETSILTGKSFASNKPDIFCISRGSSFKQFRCTAARRPKVGTNTYCDDQMVKPWRKLVDQRLQWNSSKETFHVLDSTSNPQSNA